MKKVIQRSTWFLTGLVLAYIVAASIASRGVYPDCFYNCGVVEEIPDNLINAWINGLAYENPGDNFLTVTDENAALYIYVTKKKWNYIIIELQHLNKKKMDISLLACDENWNIDKVQPLQLQSGKNILEYHLPKCKNVIIAIDHQIGTKFQITQVQFREKLITVSKKAAAIGGFVSFIVYLGISIAYSFLKRKKKIDIFRPVKIAFRSIFEIYMKCLCQITNFLWKKIGTHIRNQNSVIKRWIRIYSLGIWLLVEIFIRGYGLRSKIIPFHYIAAIVVLTLFLITALEEPWKKVSWKNPVYNWFLLSILMTISGLFASKKWPCTGILFLTVYGLWFMVWNHMRFPEIILADIIFALKLVFWITLIISAFGREYTPNMSYSGIYINRNVYSIFLIMILAANLSQLQNILLVDKYYTIKSIALCAETSLLFFLLFRTQSRGGVISAFALLCMLAFNFKQVKDRQKIKYKVLIVLQIFLFCIPVSYGTEKAILSIQAHFLPRLAYPITANSCEYDKIPFLASDECARAASLSIWDIPGERHDTTDFVYAAETANHLIQPFYAKTLDSFSSGRISIWKAYLRTLNLWGHYNKEKINGISSHAHNGLIHIAYLYGIFSVIPYCAMWLSLFLRGTALARQQHLYHSFPILLAVGFFCYSMVDALEEPFSNEYWIIMYLVIGFLFPNKHNEVIFKKIGE